MATKIEWHTCKFCGKTFHSYNRSPKYCSRTCRGKGERSKIDVHAVCKLYMEGMTISEVATQLKSTQKIVSSTLARQGIPRRIAAKREQRGPRNSSWKGDSATYHAFHRRVDAVRGKPTKCDVCGLDDPQARYDWANLTGNYADPADYKRMCKKCHAKYDRELNLKK